MLTDDREIEIISKARQPNVADPKRSRAPFEAIFSDFLSGRSHQGTRVLDLGPGQYDLHMVIAPHGATTAAIDNDPAVIELGRHKGVDAFEGNLRKLRAADFEGPYDGVFCKFSINAFWIGDAPRDHAAYVGEIDALIADGGWAWIAPWNGVPKEHAEDDAYIQRVLAAQATAFADAGFERRELTDAATKRYGVHGNVANHPIFFKGIPAPAKVTDGDRARLDVCNRPRRPESVVGTSPNAYFPFEHLQGFLRFVAEHRDRLVPISYKDLLWRQDYQAARNYPRERRRFKALSSELEQQGKAQILIQHDVDNYPERTHAAVRTEIELGVPASIMIFNRCVDRRRLNETGKVSFTDYRLQDDLLRAAEANGSVIGYHFNTMEQTGWNQRRARRRFVRDLKMLRKRFDVEFVSAHGGVRGPSGMINRDMELDDSKSLGVRWVHNGASPYFTASYSDGGPNGTTIDPATRDLRDFVRRMEPGGRYRVLLHPQYYESPCRPSYGLSGTPWYDDLLAAFKADPEFDSWRDVRLSW